MKKVGFAAGEVSLLRRVLAFLDEDKASWNARTAEHAPWSKQDLKARARILEKLTKAEQPSDPAVNAPLLEEQLIVYSGGKVAPLALPNWQRYARQGAQVGATVADAQIVGQWMSRQDWMGPGSQTLQSALNNWSSWLGKARAEQAGVVHPKAGLNGDVGHHISPQRQESSRGRPASGFGRKIPPTRQDGIQGAR